MFFKENYGFFYAIVFWARKACYLVFEAANSAITI